MHPTDREYKEACENKYLVVAVVPTGIRSYPVPHHVTETTCNDENMYPYILELAQQKRTFKVFELKESVATSNEWAEKALEFDASEQEEKEREQYERLKRKYS